MDTKPAHPPYEAALAVTFLLLLLHYFFFSEQPKLLAVSLVFVLLCLLSPAFTHLVEQFWHLFTRTIGGVMNNVLLTIVFFLLLTPIAMLYRRFKKNTFYKSKTENSYFINRNHTYKKRDLKNPW